MKTILQQCIKPISTCFTFASFLLLGLIAFLLINPSAITKLAEDSIHKIVRQYTDDNVTLGTIHWDIFPLTIKAQNVCIQEANRDNAMVCALESVELKPDIWRFLLGNYSGELHVRINKVLSLQADSNWSSDNQEIILDNAVLQYTVANKDPVTVHGNIQIHTREGILTGTLTGPNRQEARLNMDLQNAVEKLNPQMAEQNPDATTSINTDANLFEIH